MNLTFVSNLKFGKAPKLICIFLITCLLSNTAFAKSIDPPNIIVLQAYPITKGSPAYTHQFMARIRNVLREVGVDGSKIVFYPWNRGLEFLENAKNTLVLPIDNVKNRELKLKWVAPILNVNLVMVSKNSEIDSIYDAAEFNRILVRNKSNYEHILHEFGFSNVVPVTSETMHQMVLHDRAEGWFTSDIEAQESKSRNNSLTISGTLGIQKMWLAATMDVDDEFLNSIRASLHKSFATFTLKEPPDQVLNIASVNNAEMKILKELSYLYLAKNPGLKITWNLMSENLLRERVTTDIVSSNNEFDLVTVGPYEVAGWGRKGWFQPFTNIPQHYDVDDFFDHIDKSLRFKGQLLALPFYSETLLTYYRKDLLEKTQLTMPSFPTYSQISEIAAALHDPDKGIYGICLRGLPGWGQNMALFTSILESFGGNWFDEDWRPQTKSKQWYRAANYYVDLMQKFGPPNPTQQGHARLTKLFSDGKCGIWVDASVFSSQVTDPNRSRIYDKVGITAAPHQETNATHWMWYWAFAVPKNALHQSEAQKFALWATSKEYIEAVAKKYGWASAPPGTRRSTYNDDYEREAPFSAIIKHTMESNGPYPITAIPKPMSSYQFIDIPEFQLIASYAGKVMGQILDKEFGIKKGLELIHSKASEVMTKAGYIKNK